MPRLFVARALLLSSVLLWTLGRALIVQDTDSAIKFDNTWVIDGNGDNSGGSAHRTNISGGTASYQFQGTAIALHGVTHSDGAAFSFGIGSQVQQCSCYSESTTVWNFGVELCSLAQLDATATHTLIVKHTGTDGQWLNFDWLDVAVSTPSTTSTTTTTSTTSSTSSPSTSTTSSSPSSSHTSSSIPSTPSTTTTSASSTISSPLSTTMSSSSSPSGTISSSTSSTSSTSSSSPPSSSSPVTAASSSSKTGAIVGGTVGGVLGLALILLVAFLLMRRKRREAASRQLDEKPSIAQEQTFPGGQEPSSGPAPQPLIASDFGAGAAGPTYYAGQGSGSGAQAGGEMQRYSDSLANSGSSGSGSGTGTGNHPPSTAHLLSVPESTTTSPYSQLPPGPYYDTSLLQHGPELMDPDDPEPQSSFPPSSSYGAVSPPHPSFASSRLGRAPWVPQSQSATRSGQAPMSMSMSTQSQSIYPSSVAPSVSFSTQTQTQSGRLQPMFSPFVPQNIDEEENEERMGKGVEIDGWRSVIGSTSPPPPSYMTRQDSGRRRPSSPPGRESS